MDGRVITTRTYEHFQTSIEIPPVPYKRGYTVQWPEFTLNNADLTVTADTTPITYYAHFMVDGQEIGTVPFTVESLRISTPSVPAKVGYNGAWASYTLPYYTTTEPGDLTIQAVYTLKTYTVTFKMDGRVITTRTYEHFQTSIELPSVPYKRGYTVQWPEVVLNNTSFEVNAITTPITYYAHFMIDGDVIATVPFTVNTQSIPNPAIPAKVGYNAAWETYRLPYYTTTEPGDLTIQAVYTLKTYTVTFKMDGNVVATRTYQHFQTSIDIPPVPTKRGYTVAWPEIVLNNTNLIVTAITTPITYYATFMNNGEVLSKVPFTVETRSIEEPALPTPPEGYNVSWNYQLPYYNSSTPQDLYIEPLYTLKTYTVTFKMDGSVVATRTYKHGDTSITVPNVPYKRGYNVAWPAFSLSNADMTVNAITTPITYYAIFTIGGQEIGRIPFTVETRSISEPTIPAREGYDARWNYQLPYYNSSTPQDLYIEPVYSIKTYTVTFAMDGRVVATRTYEHFQTEINIPSVPYKRGYTVAWPAFTLDNADLTVNAITTINTYYAYFMDGEQVIATVPFTVETRSIEEPALPTPPEGYNLRWEYQLPYYNNSEPQDLYIEPRLSIKTYTITFMMDGEIVGTRTYEHFQTEFDRNLLPNPYKRGYTVTWPAFTLNNADLTVTAITTPITYYAYFMDGGQVIATVPFTVETQSIEEPALPTPPEGYNVRWNYELPYYNNSEPQSLYVEPLYTIKTYTVTFKYGNQTWTRTYEHGATSVSEPTPYKRGYTVVWENYTLNNADITVTAIETINTYYANFMVDGVVIGRVPFTVNTTRITEPEIPAREGFIGEWSSYTLPYATSTEPTDLFINARYVRAYTVTFVYGSQTWVRVYKHGATSVNEPTPYKRGYTVEWEDYTLNNTNITVYAREAINTYYAIFKIDGEEVARVPFTVNTQWITEPTIPAREGYNGAWASYTLPYYTSTEPTNLTINASYTIKTYTVTFMHGTQTWASVTYEHGDTSIAIPSVPTKRGYTVAWPAFSLSNENITVYADETINTYYVTFMADGEEIARVPFTVKTRSITEPTVPVKDGHTGAWASYTLPYYHTGEPADMTVEAVYTHTFYTVTFLYGSQVTVVTYKQGATSIAEPTLPTKRGYTLAWEPYALNNTSFTVRAIETRNTYYAIFMLDGMEIKRVPFYVDTETLPEPTIPEKLGYTAAWSAYTLPFYHANEPTNLTLTAQYTPIVYTATFMADGQVVATVPFTVEDTALSLVPEVPSKQGHTGVWAEYVLGASDITIEAVYTETGLGAVIVATLTGMPWFLWLLIALILIGIAVLLIVLFFIKRKTDDDDDDTPTPPTPVVVPVATPDPEPEVIAEPEPVSVPVPSIPVPPKVLSATSRAIINLSDLDAYFAEGDTVSLEILKAKKLVSVKEKRLKILGGGMLTKPLTVEAEFFSASAKNMIIAVGGTVIQKH